VVRHSGLGIEKRLGILPGRSFTLLATGIDAAVFLRPELHAAYYKSWTRLTAAEQNVFQHVAALPRLDQDAS